MQITPVTQTRSKVYINKSKTNLSNCVHWRISKDLKKKETELMEQLSIAKRTKLYGHLLNNAHSMIMPIEN